MSQTGAKLCAVCGGELAFEAGPPPDERGLYVQAQMELDQVQAPAGRNVERHLLVTLRTPLEIPASELAATATGRPALGFTAVLDVSGSMNGEKLAQPKDAIRQALNRLKDGDTLALVTFSNEVRCVLVPTRVDDRIRRVVESALREISATDLAIGSNFLMLNGKPGTGSLLDILPAWPYYLPYMELIGLVTCLLLYLPFSVAYARAAHSHRAS